ncbi:MAG TPA: tRNA1(Val) (adenine(37)-N6)-methyltransferase [Selenomonadales bacterium]|nr:tRNA1(Val) (adenine(37)-N6)-methyltransferase [Selenomonadales bacterium]
MDSESLLPGERVDDLLINGLKIIQQGQEFRFSLDSVLLAHFATVRPGDKALDLGAGTGVLGLLLAARGVSVACGVEINPRMAQMAERSIRLNKLAERVSVVRGDVRELDKALLPCDQWDLVVTNPPYRPLGGGKISPLPGVAAARHETAGTLTDFVAAARSVIRQGGRFAMVHLAERLTEIMAVMNKAGIEPKRLRLVHPMADKKAKLLLVEGVRAGRPGLSVLPPLFVYHPEGTYSNEIMAYYQAGE